MKRQRGAALLMAMLTVTLVAAFAAAALWRQWRAVEVETAERTRVQSFNDFLVFGTMAVASFSSGQILAKWGWDPVNWVAFPPILAALLALALSGAYRRRAAA